MSTAKNFFLAACLAALAAPASAALTYVASGNYTVPGLGSNTSTPSACGDATPNGGGLDVLDFTGSGANNIGLHGYACTYGGVTSFGSRASGDGSYSVKSVGGVTGTISTSDGDGFTFNVSAGEVGAFGAVFGAGEFQKSSLSIQLIIDGTTYMDLAWSAEVGAGGVVSHSYTDTGSLSFAVSEAGGGAGENYFSYGLAGGTFNVALADGEHNISYLLTAEASGNVIGTSVCSAVLYGGPNGNGDIGALAVEVPQEGGPQAGAAFTSYCGAGARTGDPFGAPIAQAQDVQVLPEPVSASLALTALIAAAGARRRTKR